MRRAPIVITATLLGTAGVLLFKPPGTTDVVNATQPAATGSSSSSTSSGAASEGTGSSGSASSGSSDDASAAPSASATSGSSSTSSAKDGTYTGTAETVRFGTTQVKVTVSGGRITEVETVQENQADPRSYQISEGAIPTLRQEVLSQQTAAVDTVSGATWTSTQYEASLQSALDQAGFAAADGSKASTDLSTLQESGGGH